MSFKTKDEFWDAVVRKYPDFADEEHVVKQRARGLKALLGQAFDMGHEQGVRNGKAMAAMESERKKPSGRDPMDLFNEVFGKG